MKNYFVMGAVIFLLVGSVGYFVHQSIVDKMGREYVYMLSAQNNRILELEKSIEPVVVFNPGGKFTASEKEMINERLINPLVDYYRMHEDLPTVYGVMISPSDGKVYSYEVDVLLRGGGKDFVKNGYYGFLYGNFGKTPEYWQPECMGRCVLNPEYMAKYPYIR